MFRGRETTWWCGLSSRGQKHQCGTTQLSSNTPLSHPDTPERLKLFSWTINTGWLFRVIMGKKDTI